MIVSLKRKETAGVSRHSVQRRGSQSHTERQREANSKSQKILHQFKLHLRSRVSRLKILLSLQSLSFETSKENVTVFLVSHFYPMLLPPLFSISSLMHQMQGNECHEMLNPKRSAFILNPFASLSFSDCIYNCWTFETRRLSAVSILLFFTLSFDVNVVWQKNRGRERETHTHIKSLSFAWDPCTASFSSSMTEMPGVEKQFALCKNILLKLELESRDAFFLSFSYTSPHVYNIRDTHIKKDLEDERRHQTNWKMTAASIFGEKKCISRDLLTRRNHNLIFVASID